MTTNRDIWGVACLKCGKDDDLRVELRVLAKLTPNGTEIYGEREWDSECFMYCGHCGNDGIVADFSTRGFF